MLLFIFAARRVLLVESRVRISQSHLLAGGVGEARPWPVQVAPMGCIDHDSYWDIPRHMRHHRQPGRTVEGCVFGEQEGRSLKRGTVKLTN